MRRKDLTFGVGHAERSLRFPIISKIYPVAEGEQFEPSISPNPSSYIFVGIHEHIGTVDIFFEISVACWYPGSGLSEPARSGRAGWSKKWICLLALPMLSYYWLLWPSPGFSVFYLIAGPSDIHQGHLVGRSPAISSIFLGKNHGLSMRNGHSTTMLGDHVIILSSVNIANDLLEKRSRVYSSRPHPEVAESSGWGFDIATQPYTNAWRKQRKTYQQHLRPDAVIELRPTIKDCISVFLNNLLHTPDNFMGHMDLLSCSLALSSMYGVTLRSANDPLLRLAKEAVHTLDTVFSTRYTFLVSYFPFIRFIPGWVPILGSIARFIECTKKLCHDLREIPFNQVIEDVESGLDNGGLIARVLRKDTTTTEEIGQIKDMAAITLIASADTTSSSLGTFFMAMAKNPQCQERAWQEIDAVRRGRLPTFEDRKSMPYVEAIYREVMRWHPAVPLGVAHSSIEDDIYNEYYLPRGSIVFANIWAMTHDERVYRDPYHFIPERFFNADGTLNDDDTISRAKDAQGNEIDIAEKYSDGPGQFRYYKN
ncbi:cytochrome p450 2 [Moniliophthora roreri]|nr:cytochrome p450 2 [Moniliophthora roreri]